MANHIYIVTRTVNTTEKNGSHLPNLGVHSTYKGSENQFGSIVKDRINRLHAKVIISRKDSGSDLESSFGKVRKEAKIEYQEGPHFIEERLLIEEWSIRKKSRTKNEGS